MESSECQVCSLKSSCEGNELFLYAPTDILSTRTKTVLESSEIAFSQKGRTFALHSRSGRDEILIELQSRLSPPEAEDLRVTFDLANLMAATSLTQAANRTETSWFEDALRADRFVHWFQPIVDARRQVVVGHECLIRLPKNDGANQFHSGQEIIDAAISRGDLHVFDSYSRRTAIRNAGRLHTSGKVFVNFTPSSIYDPAFCMASTLQAMQSTHFQPSDIVFEVVECERVRDPRHLRKIADYYRAKGFTVALDDVGTGSNSLQMISDIQPDFFKLDKSIVWKYDTEIGRKTLRKLHEIGAESGIATIAEGVETEAMRDTLLDCGFSLMQGYFFGRPAPAMANEFATPVSSSSQSPRP